MVRARQAVIRAYLVQRPQSIRASLPGHYWRVTVALRREAPSSPLATPCWFVPAGGSPLAPAGEPDSNKNRPGGNLSPEGAYDISCFNK